MADRRDQHHGGGRGRGNHRYSRGGSSHGGGHRSQDPNPPTGHNHDGGGSHNRFGAGHQGPSHDVHRRDDRFHGPGHNEGNPFQGQQDGFHAGRHGGGVFRGPGSTGGHHDFGHGQGRGHGHGNPMHRPSPGIFVDPRATQECDAAKTLQQATERTENNMVAASLARSNPPTGFMPQRPGYGHEKAKDITVWANHFRITPTRQAMDQKFLLYRYSVAAARVLNSPAAGSSDMNASGAVNANSAQAPSQISKYDLKRLIVLLLKDDRFSDAHKATDYANCIVTNKLVVGNDGWSGECDISEQQGRPRLIRFKVLRTGEFNWSSLVEYLELGGPFSMLASSAKKEELLQVLNIIFGYNTINARPNIAQVGPKNTFFEVQNPAFPGRALGDVLEAFKGFYASARPATRNLLLNLNVVNTAFYKPGNLLSLVKSIINQRASHTDLKRLDRMFKHVRVEISHQRLRDSKGQKLDTKPLAKIKTIKGFSIITLSQSSQRPFHTAATMKFTDAAGSSVSVQEYFRNTYKRQVQSDWPLCDLGTPQRAAWTPLELCTVLPGQAYRRLLDSSQTSEMIKCAAQPPNVNLNSIVSQGLDVFGLKDPRFQQSNIEPWGMMVDRHPMQVPARILRPPSLSYGLFRGKSTSLTPTEGDWNLIDRPFIKPGRIEKLILIEVLEKKNFSPPVPVKDFKGQLEKTGLKIASMVKEDFRLREASLPLGDAAKAQGVDNALRGFFEQYGKEKAVLAIFILPRNDKWFYSRIKYLGDVVYGVPTVCTVASKICKGGALNKPHVGNMALKVNIKTGGVNHLVSSQASNGRGATLALKYADEHTMFVGIDVTHPSPGSSESSPSIAAVVASVDEYLAQWPVSLSAQTGREEEVQGLKALMLQRLQHWQRQKSSLPRRIIVYRDGVSEGQYSTLVQSEIAKLKEAIAVLYGPQPRPQPKLTFLVVGKRHHTRFYPMSNNADEYTSKTFNCKPGTVVDRGVTAPDLHDFFLIAHKGLQGTAKPAHYVVALDENGMGADDLQRLTYELCYTFNRATKSISVCPPAFYADLACERARYYLYGALVDPDHDLLSATNWQGHVHPNIRDTTFYI